ncbi:Lpz3p [Nannizzia gypsea CBS 118893]|uniref:Lpz3p n=1 Tax=Arthroderma gypseum (strain ATCC MYA-4604 / CBS 118893) TaxID=535722 RepID=E5R145_ARTGP|nr:Lpz3p [Nannizzia gypsea CBS 118893]EFQ97649.1 Lpz3p [Nannizzia gypsea CBS 118893]
MDNPPGNNEVSASSRLLDSHTFNQQQTGGDARNRSHGTFTPASIQSYGEGSQLSETGYLQGRDGISSAPSGGRSATKQLAEAHGLKNHRAMYLAYYVPFFNWITQYRWSYLRGDFISALTVCSVYVPMCLSLASNVAHIPAINGLYSFIFHPFIYAIFGSSPLLIVGPEAAGSLLVGTVVRSTVEDGKGIDDDPRGNAAISGIVVGMCGAMTLIGGITRLGFVDNILSRPFLRGFISAIGFMIMVDQLVPEMGLSDRAREVLLGTYGSSAEKLMFLIQNVTYSHGLTCAVSFSTIAIIMVFRVLKKHLQPRYSWVVFFPEQFIVVVLSAVLTWALEWDKKGLVILGNIKGTSNLFRFEWPFQAHNLENIRNAMSTSFIISLLGFFESSVAAKGIRSATKAGIEGMTYSPNRELVALGVSNMVGGCFLGLPAFGGYGRSKLSALTGAKTPMAGIFVALITLASVIWLLPYFYYLPTAVLSALISVVSYTLIEECPEDIRFFIRIRGWSELALMLLIFFSTFFYSLYLGIALGLGLSLLQIIRHATKPRIQILGKVHGTRDRFENAEIHPERVEYVAGSLIVKIPEPLTFANTGDLKNRLRRLEFYGTNAAHPALPRVRAPEHNKNIIFDIHGVTSIDGSGVQVLSEIVEEYVSHGVRVFFCRIPLPGSEVFKMMENSGIIDTCGGISHFVPTVENALQLAETEYVNYE